MADALVRAVKKLRERLGDSQQAFATRLGLSIRTIANYEGGRRPSGKPIVELLRLADAAAGAGNADLQGIFLDALSDELDSWGFTILMTPPTKTRPAGGYIKLRLEGYEALRGAHD